jgi:hypothetical protein
MRGERLGVMMDDDELASASRGQSDHDEASKDLIFDRLSGGAVAISMIWIKQGYGFQLQQ